MSERKQNWYTRFVKWFGPGLYLESGNPTMGIGGASAFSLFSSTKLGRKFSLGMKESGIVSLNADSTLEIIAGEENDDGGEDKNMKPLIALVLEPDAPASDLAGQWAPPVQGKHSKDETMEQGLARQRAAKRRMLAHEADLRADAVFWANWKGPTSSALPSRAPVSSASERLEALRQRIRRRHA